MAAVIVLDASVLIAYLDRNDNHHDRAYTLLEREVGDDFAVNTLTLAEVLVAPAREGRIDAVRAALLDLGIAEMAFPSETAVSLADLRASTTLKMPDCCVLLAAEHSQARLASFDDRLAAAASSRGLIAVTR
jgi:predicted nucleic acid-binding protein